MTELTPSFEFIGFAKAVQAKVASANLHVPGYKEVAMAALLDAVCKVLDVLPDRQGVQVRGSVSVVPQGTSYEWVSARFSITLLELDL